MNTVSNEEILHHTKVETNTYVITGSLVVITKIL